MSSKVDLTMINRLVSELSKQLDLADSIDRSALPHDYFIEMSKAMGIATAINTEALGLVSDIVAATAPTNQSSKDLMSSLLTGKKKLNIQ